MNIWIISNNLNDFDSIGALKTLGKVDWRQGRNKFNVGDIIYLYISKPIQKIKFKCRVNKIDLNILEIDDSDFENEAHDVSNNEKYMEIEMLEEYDQDELSAANLAPYGFYPPQGRMYLKGKLLERIEEIVGKTFDNDKSTINKVNSEVMNNNTNFNGDNKKYPLNQILYGPPGTGKTYNTVYRAVAICENKEIDTLQKECAQEADERNSSLPDNKKVNSYTIALEKYEALKACGRIACTTFHQSYGYEEFIEGIKPIENNEDDYSDNTGGEIKYACVDGVFKRFCENVTETTMQSLESLGVNKNPEIWKVSLEHTGPGAIRTDCLENGRIRMGGDLTSELTEDGKYYTGKNKSHKALVNRMNIGDIVVSCYYEDTIDAIGVVESEFDILNDVDYYKNSRKVKWILKKEVNISKYTNGKKMGMPTIYRIWALNVADITDILKENGVLKEISYDTDPKVFIIDEINRGNISKIFGELITLIEDTKRAGASEAMSATLPYSGAIFSVPDNVYIIGTMNTADRSIALMDTALRRRFEFVEMMPDASVLVNDNGNKIEVDGIDIQKILETINKRIEFFYDREHTIGHAYFSKLNKMENRNINVLAQIFHNKVIPLLQEYFYDDYEKLYYILGDNDKSSDKYKFVVEEKQNVNDIFMGSRLEEKKTFGRKKDHIKYALNKGRDGDDPYICAESYIGIYSKINVGANEQVPEVENAGSATNG